MLRNVILLALTAAAFAAVPALYERNPQMLDAVLGGGAEQAGPKGAERVATAQKAEPLLGRKVRVPADMRGHYAADFRLNGRTVEALVDTGATVVAINTSTARRIGVRLSPSDFRHEVQTANGRARAAMAVLDSVEIGRIHVEGVRALVLEDDALAGTLVGMSFLNRLSRFHVEDGELLLEQ